MYRRRMPEEDVSVPYSGDTVSLPVEGGRVREGLSLQRDDEGVQHHDQHAVAQ
jgi:hypothetical protein